ncbi:LLM class flavin-dependent oxidoreductase [Nocardia sp. NPDC023852]|uniref:LLM class flavin-dependent oxidoreductase n=1 Tax=Nocardia sp. NPDC023852 TaxID=3154697 RepID=UPI0033FEBA1A
MAHTTTVKVAGGIILLPLRNAVVLAKELTSLDRVADGRLIVGVGPGYVPEEFAAVGVAMSERAARTAASAAVSTSTLPVACASDSCTRSGSCASVTSTPKCQPCAYLSGTASLIATDRRYHHGPPDTPRSLKGDQPNAHQRSVIANGLVDGGVHIECPNRPTTSKISRLHLSSVGLSEQTTSTTVQVPDWRPRPTALMSSPSPRGITTIWR